MQKFLILLLVGLHVVVPNWQWKVACLNISLCIAGGIGGSIGSHDFVA